MEQHERVSPRWGGLIGYSLLITAATTGVRWVFDPDAPWTDHLILGAIAGATWCMGVVLISALQRRRKSQR